MQENMIVTNSYIMYKRLTSIWLMIKSSNVCPSLILIADLHESQNIISV